MATEAEYTLPIGEVARLTGVNPVTLRAWQRRFGLVTPQRTPKGHRLYSQAQVEEIKEILHWLQQGVAISRVKPLLNSNSDTQPLVDSEDDQDWQQLVAALDNAVFAMKAVTLLQRLDEVTSLYPMPVCGDKLSEWLQNLDNQLLIRVDGELIGQWLARQLQHYLSLRIESVMRQKPRNVLLLALNEQPPHQLWIWQLAILAQGRLPLLFNRSTEIDALTLICERLQPEAMLVMPAAHTNLSTLSQLSQLSSKVQLNTALCGCFASLLQPQLAHIDNLNVVESIQQLAQWHFGAQEVQR
ncbi:MerR family transcriptional regulator [Shewanella mangrovi]|uniref:MerR family transcriptional regulator n=1 Tax=Shewanella mangrovi TaxID=1515746 RepID=UPI000691A85A|nr:MerR family transcriptional regulator [Shewanella mangrovi]